MKISVRLKSSDLTRTIKSFPEQIKRTGESVLRQESRQFAKELARWTLPIGLGDDAWRKLANKIASEIRRVIVSPRRLYEAVETADGKPFADALWALLQGKPGGRRGTRNIVQHLARSRSATAKLILGGNVRPEAVKALRTGPWGNIPTGTSDRMIVTNTARIDAFIKRMQRRVGFAKGGWSAAARSLSGRNVQGIPQWASYGRHKAPGSGIFTKPGKRIRLTNEVDYSRKALPPSCEQRAKFNAQRNLRLALTHAVNALAAKQFRRGGRRAA